MPRRPGAGLRLRSFGSFACLPARGLARRLVTPLLAWLLGLALSLAAAPALQAAGPATTGPATTGPAAQPAAQKAQAPGGVQAPKPPYGVAVLPFTDRRHPDEPSWLGRFLQERIGAALLRTGQLAVPEPDTAAQWERKLGLHLDAPVTAAQLDAMGVRVLIQGATQEVLGLVEVDLRVRTAQGDLLGGPPAHLRVLLRQEPPGAVLRRLLGALQGALAGPALSDPKPPADWAGVEALYTLLTQPIVPGDLSARPALVARLRPLAQDPELGPRAREALATLLMEQALLYLPQGAGRELMLQDALQQASAALQADPRDTHRQALRAELLIFLKHYYEAKTDASVARLHNPLESLSYVVLAMVAGLSTGEATVHLERALAINPFLRTEARVPGSAPYQGGVLEDTFQRWQTLRANGGLARTDDTAQLMDAGIRHFEHKEWEEAERAFQQAAQREDADFTPWLYLNRILIELGHPERAVAPLQRLADANPQEPEILYWLATAQNASGSPQEARANFRKILVEHPDDVRTLQGLGQADMSLGRWQDALEDLRGVLQMDPGQADAWLRLGLVQAQLGDWDASEGALERALELQPDSADARRALDEARVHLGKEPITPAPAASGATPGAEQGAAPQAPAPGK
jgi:tetratricopeptide (TPR) repeat protein